MQNFRMIDVGEKAITRRRAVATGKIRLHPDAIAMVKSGVSPKGNILAMAEVAGIMAAKNTAQILPLCHPLAMDSVRIWFEVVDLQVQGFCEAICHGKTGVEMEAMMGISAALLTIYDLSKIVHPEIEMSEIYLLQKEGGKSGNWFSTIPQSKGAITPKIDEAQVSKQPVVSQELNGMKYSVLTLSDRASSGIYEDKSGPILAKFCRDHGATEFNSIVIPDDSEVIRRKVLEASEQRVNLILLTGGTGIGPRDVTIEAIRSVSSKELIGLGEAQRVYGAKFTPKAWLSRSSAFVVNKSLVVVFPGSPKAVTQGLEAVGSLLGHAAKMIQGGNHDSIS